MTDDKMTAVSPRTLAIRARIAALIGECVTTEPSKRVRPLPAKVRTIRRRVNKFKRLTRRAKAA